MTQLATQLQTLKRNKLTQPLAPLAQQPTLILPKHTASTISTDIVYTMAVIAYSKLVKEDERIKVEGEVVMGSEYKDVKRNMLNK